jgi:putative MATE family efflux protein
MMEDGARKAAPENLERIVWALAWPTIIANVLQNAAGLIDLYFVRGLGVGAQQAVTWGEQIIGVVFAVSIGVSVGTTALVARFVGARDEKSIGIAVRQSILLMIGLAIVTTVALWYAAPPILTALGADRRSMPAGLDYCRTLLWGVGFFFINAVAAGAFRGAGDTRTPVYVFGTMNVINILLDAVLIWGWGPFPKWGIHGAAVAAVISRGAATLLFLWMLNRTDLPLHLRRGSWRPRWDWWWRLLRIGIPASMQAGLRTLASATFVGVLGSMENGASVVAALAVGLRAEGLAFMPGMAFNIAASALVGQSLGMGDPERAKRAAWTAVRQSMIIMSIMGALFYVFADPLAAKLAATDAAPYAASYLRINAFCEPLLAVAMTLGGALQGAGETIKPMFVMILTMWGVRLPATWYLGLRLGYGADGAWWAMSGSTMVQGLMMAFVWRRGAWRHKKV